MGSASFVRVDASTTLTEGRKTAAKAPGLFASFGVVLNCGVVEMRQAQAQCIHSEVHWPGYD